MDMAETYHETMSIFSALEYTETIYTICDILTGPLVLMEAVRTMIPAVLVPCGKPLSPSVPKFSMSSLT